MKYIRLIPSKKHVPNSNAPVPDFGGGLQFVLDEANEVAETLCNRKLQSDYEQKVRDARAKLKKPMDFQIVLNKTKCKVHLVKLQEKNSPEDIHAKYQCRPDGNHLDTKKSSKASIVAPGSNIEKYVITLTPLIKIGEQLY